MKKFFLLLTLLCLSLSARAHDAEVDGIFYNLDAANKTATVTFKGDNYWDDDEYSGDAVIPETVTYNGVTYSVTSLGEWCFASCSSLTAITIPNSVTSLGTGCFADCSSLERMVVDAANPVYDSREDCNAIIHTSTNELIAGCKNSQIPNSVTSLGNRCFYGCSSLTSI
ncbi:MAG: leucine-rich repeat domain-containing protein, partial [Prevotellamassilia sp.]|nr:leucine-rich repeat domain-containing protein [Prevotellamassilia sp.]